MLRQRKSTVTTSLCCSMSHLLHVAYAQGEVHTEWSQRWPKSQAEHRPIVGRWWNRQSQPMKPPLKARQHRVGPVVAWDVARTKGTQFERTLVDGVQGLPIQAIKMELEHQSHWTPPYERNLRIHASDQHVGDHTISNKFEQPPFSSEHPSVQKPLSSNMLRGDGQRNRVGGHTANALKPGEEEIEAALVEHRETPSESVRARSELIGRERRYPNTLPSLRPHFSTEFILGIKVSARKHASNRITAQCCQLDWHGTRGSLTSTSVTGRRNSAATVNQN